MSGHEDDPIDDGLPTMIDLEVPTGGRDRPATFDPHARIGNNRRTPATGARTVPAGARPVAAEVLSALPPVLPEPAPHKQHAPSSFDPHARIDDVSRTSKWVPRQQEETLAEPTASAARRTKPETKKGHDVGPGVAPLDARTVVPASPAARTVGPGSPPLDVSAAALPPVPTAPMAAVVPSGHSEPMRVISMKTPADLEAERAKAKRVLPVVKLRAIGDVHQTPARGMGNLAPPRDPTEARSRRVRDNVIWGSVAVILASIVTLAIWFLARR